MVNRLKLTLLGVFIGVTSMAQDVGVTGFVDPVDGCALTNNETVTVTIENFGAVPMGPFDVGFRVDNGAPVIETYVGSIPAGGTDTYTFTAPANLSTLGNTYLLDAWTEAVGDADVNNDSIIDVAVINYALSDGGTTAPNDTVCSGSNSGTITLSGETGAVLFWEFSTDGGATWSFISNTSNSQSFTNLTTTTLYRAVVRNGLCPPDVSTETEILVYAGSVGGTVNSSTNVCEGSNSGTLNLTGQAGSVIDWESSIDGGATWTSLGNTNTTQSYNNLTVETWYRAVVELAPCAPTTSSIAVISIDPPTVAGTVSGDATVCSGSNSGTVTLSGETGTILEWVESTDGGTTWSSIANATNTQGYNNITTTTQYAAVVQSGACPADTSTAATITVDPVSDGGTVNSDANVCIGSNSGTLTLTGFTGTILDWEFSTDGGATWTSIGNTTTTQNYTNLTVTTMYRAIVQSGVCPSATSVPATITMDPLSVGGTVSSDATVCEGSNSGTVTLSGETGSVIEWVESTDGGTTWTSIANTTSSQNYNNLTTTTEYAAVVQSGSCPPDTSSPAIITVDPASIGGTVNSSTNVCSGSNSGTLTLTGETGSIVEWISSTDGGVTWTSIANTTNTQNYTNLTTDTEYAVVVQSGTCPTDTATSAIITVDPASVGGSAGPDAAECSGTNSGTINLTGETGSVTEWVESTDGGLTWTSIANTTTSLTYNNLTTTTQYAAVVQSGACPADTSSAATITINPGSVGGTITPANDTVCTGTNSGTLTLAGESGNIIGWEESTDGGATWSALGNTTNSESFSNLTTTTEYQVIVQLPGCPADTSTISEVFVAPLSVAGTLASDQTVCSGSNTGTLNLTGETGSVVDWEESTDGGVTWSAIGNTTTSFTFNNLTTTTDYRVIVQSGPCSNDTSNVVTVTVTPPSVGGTLSPANDTVCVTANSGTITLSGESGTIIDWETSIDGGTTWTGTGNTTNTENYTNLTTTTLYRVIVGLGACPPDTSSVTEILVSPESVGGTTSGPSNVCLSTGSDTLFLNGQVGDVLYWESSIDSGATWNNLPTANDTLLFSGLTDTTWFRAIVQSGVCVVDTSDTTVVNVDLPSVGGTIVQDTAVCVASSNDTLILINYTGDVLYWENTFDGGATWNTVSNTSDTLIYSVVSFTTAYRAIVQNGTCEPDTSAVATIVVSPETVGGTVTGSTTVCEGFNNGSLTLAGNVGNVLYWESSVDSGATWTNIPVSSTTLPYTNVNDTTWFRAIVQSGPCPVDTSSIGIIFTYPSPVAGFVVNDTCLGDAVQFTNQSTISSGVIQFTVWDFGDFDASVASDPFHTYSDTGTYTVELVAISNNGCTDTATADIDIFPNPDATIMLSGVDEFCEGDSVDLYVNSGNYTYTWNTGATDTLITVDTSNTYTVMVTDTATGCMSMDSVDITVHPAIVTDIIPDSTISLGSTIELWASGGTMYEWSPDSTLDNPFSSMPMATPSENTTYQVIITDANNCSDTLETEITLNADQLLDVTNLFTPNGDGFNDFWTIGNIENYQDATVTIFNRYGMELYSTTGYQNDWDGTRNGKNVPDGAYYYLITFPDSDVVYKGSVTILRKNE